MKDANYWLQAMYGEGRFEPLNEGYAEDTILYINRALAEIGSETKQSKFLEDLKKYLQKNNHLTDGQQQALADITRNMSFDKNVKGKGKEGDTAEKPKEKETKGEEPEGKEKEEKGSKAVSKEQLKNTKAAVAGAMKSLGKGLGSGLKNIATKIDPALVGAVEKGVEAGKSVKDAAKDAIKARIEKAKESINKEIEKLEKQKEGTENKDKLAAIDKDIEKLKAKLGNE